MAYKLTCTLCDEYRSCKQGNRIPTDVGPDPPMGNQK